MGSTNRLIDCSDGRRRHLVLFYENERAALGIQADFVKSGLSKGEHCIFSTHKSVKSIEKELSNHGIDVDHFKKRNLLDVQNMIEPKGPDAVKSETERVNEFLKQKPHLQKRIVGGYGYDVTIRHNVDAGIVIEQFADSIFADVNGSLLCYYHVKKVPIEDRTRWMVEMLKIHDVAIFVDKKGPNQVIEL